MVKKLVVLTALSLGLAFAQQGQTGGQLLLDETKKTAEAISTFLTVVLGGGTILLAVGAIVMSAVMGYKAYQTSKDQRDVNPTLNGLKTFLLWAVGSIAVLGGLITGTNTILDGVVLQAVKQLVQPAGGGQQQQPRR